MVLLPAPRAFTVTGRWMLQTPPALPETERGERLRGEGRTGRRPVRFRLAQGLGICYTFWPIWF